MRRLGIALVGFGLLGFAFETLPLRAQVFVFDDGDFDGGGWLPTYDPPEGASVAISFPETGGNPGSYFRVRHEHSDNPNTGLYLVSSYLFQTARILRPEVDGPIGRLRFTFQKRRLDPVLPGDGNVALYPALRQAGRIYVATNPFCEGVVGEWGLYHESWAIFSADCSAADFDDLDEPGRQNPDFSASGLGIELGFGFLTLADDDLRPGPTMLEAGLDDFHVYANPEAPPPQTTVPGLTIAVDDHGVTWWDPGAPGPGPGFSLYDMTVTNETEDEDLFIVAVTFNTVFEQLLGSDVFFDSDGLPQCLYALSEGLTACGTRPFQIPPPSVGNVLQLGLGVQLCGAVDPDVVCHTPDHTIFFTADLVRASTREIVARSCAATPGRPCYVDGRPCCLAEALGAAFQCPVIIPGVRSTSAQASAAEEHVDATLLFDLRDRVLRATPGGRRATDLYYEWTDDVVRTAIFAPSLFGMARDALLAWQPLLRDLVEGEGQAVIGSEQMGLLNTFLGALKQEASDELREAIEREERNWDLASWTGLTIGKALERMNRFPCEEGDYTLCVDNERFRVETVWQKSDGELGVGHAVRLTEDTGYFWFFHPDNVEQVVKVLDGCGVNGKFWAFGAGLTNVEVRTEVTDTWTGESKVYLNPQGAAFDPFQDTDFSQGCGAVGGSRAGPTESASEPPASPAFSATAACAPSDTALCLNGGRFRVEAEWENARGDRGAARASPLTSDTGTFWFFDPENLEMIVKVLPGCSLNQRQWVFAGGLTNVRVDWRVTDTLTGEFRTFANPLGTAFRPVQDTSAFACP